MKVAATSDELMVSNRSLITGRGATKREGGEFYLYKRRGGGVSAKLKGGGTISLGVVLTQELEVLAILMGGGGGSFHPL